VPTVACQRVCYGLVKGRLSRSPWSPAGEHWAVPTRRRKAASLSSWPVDCISNRTLGAPGARAVRAGAGLPGAREPGRSRAARSNARGRPLGARAAARRRARRRNGSRGAPARREVSRGFSRSDGSRGFSIGRDGSRGFSIGLLRPGR